MQTKLSQTQTQQNSPAQAVLHLRPGSATADDRLSQESRPRVRWESDVVDNENMNKKKSKICCIFHPQREFCESSDEALCSSSESSDSSDEEDGGKGHNHVDPGSGDPGHSHGHGQNQCCSKKKVKTKKPRAATPNAYERQPQYKNRSTLPENAI